MRDNIIYLASPYSGSDEQKIARYEAAIKTTVFLIKEGHNVYSPIVHSHPLSKKLPPQGWDFWKAIDFPMLDRCDLLMVLTIEGWRSSVGVQEEIAYAATHSIPISYIDIDGKMIGVARMKEGDGR